MGYGTISGMAFVAPMRDSLKGSPTPRPGDVLTPNRVVNERTRLIARRRPARRRTTSDALCNWRILFLLMILLVGVFIGIHLLIIEYKEWPVNYPFHLITRNVWYQGESLETLNLTHLDSSQVNIVVILHTRGKHCYNVNTCLLVINELQKYNMTEIPFNFLIGGDGKTYELRGWSYLSGFEDLPFNNRSLTVGLMGDFTSREPAFNQVQEVEAFISESIRRQKLSENYVIHGVQLYNKDGSKMFAQFKTFVRWAGMV